MAKRPAIQLQPYPYQVGGCSCVMLYNKSTICKPLQSREYHFYLRMPEVLKPFTAGYKGVANVVIERDRTGLISCFAFANSFFPSLDELQNHFKENTKDEEFVPCNKDHIEHCVPERCSSFEDSNGSEGLRSPWLPPGVSNPWTKEVLGRLTRRLPSDGRITETFILLENITVGQKRPCILDLKMGVRQHHEDASQEKIDRGIKRIESSTSSTLGARLCGMQVYNPEDKSYSYLDKFKGRALNRQELESNLKLFFGINTKLRTEILENCITKLVALTNCLRSLEDYRFYSSSLLIVYDACAKDAAVDVRIIDFANISSVEFGAELRGHDEGILFGLENLIRLLRNFLMEYRDEMTTLS